MRRKPFSFNLWISGSEAAGGGSLPPDGIAKAKHHPTDGLRLACFELWHLRT